MFYRDCRSEFRILATKYVVHFNDKQHMKLIFLKKSATFSFNVLCTHHLLDISHCFPPEVDDLVGQCDI